MSALNPSSPTELEALLDDQLTQIVVATGGNGRPINLPALLAAFGPERPCPALALPRGRSLINVAITSKSLAVLQAYLDAGADPNGGIALSMAVHYDRPDLCEALLQAGADPQQAHKSQPVSPLNEAASRPAPDTLRALLAHGADPNAPDPRGELPLCACWTIENARLLIEAGGDPRIANRFGDTPEESALLRGEQELAAFFSSQVQARALAESTPEPSTAQPAPRRAL